MPGSPPDAPPRSSSAPGGLADRSNVRSSRARGARAARDAGGSLEPTRSRARRKARGRVAARGGRACGRRWSGRCRGGAPPRSRRRCTPRARARGRSARRRRGRAAALRRGPPARDAAGALERKVRGAQPRPARERERGLDRVLELADVAGPAVARAAARAPRGSSSTSVCPSRRCFARKWAARSGTSSMRSRSGGHVDAHHVEPVVEVEPEAPVLDHRREVAVGRGDHADVDRHRRRSRRPDAPRALERAQQLGLHARAGSRRPRRGRASRRAPCGTARARRPRR